MGNQEEQNYNNPPAYNQNEVSRDIGYGYGAQPQQVLVNGPHGVNPLPPAQCLATKGNPVKMNCPNCGCTVITYIKAKSSTRTFVSAGVLLVVFWPLAFIPFVTKKLKKKTHVCPNCQYNIGKEFMYTPVP